MGYLINPVEYAYVAYPVLSNKTEPNIYFHLTYVTPRNQWLRHEENTLLQAARNNNYSSNVLQYALLVSQDNFHHAYCWIKAVKKC